MIDHRKLNENIVDEKYPIPKFEDIFVKVSGALIFSTLELKAGYHQIKMYPKEPFLNIKTDASEYALGVVVSQQRDGENHSTLSTERLANL